MTKKDILVILATIFGIFSVTYIYFTFKTLLEVLYG